MRAKEKIYVMILAILIFFGLFLLLLYYIQEFDEEMFLANIIEYDNLNLDPNPFTSDNLITRINSVEVNVGKISLTNNGIFTKVYVFPRLAGCIDFISEEVARERENSFNIQYVGEGVTYEYGDDTEVKVDEEAEFELVATYRPSGIDPSNFDKGEIKSISVFKLPRKGKNPFGYYENYYPSYRRGYDYCDTLRKELKPLKVIPII